MNSLSPDSAKFKICKKCGPPEKPLSEFYKGAAKDGKDSYCKPCRSLINREQRETSKTRTPDQREEKSTHIGRALLSEQGIPCVTGRESGLPWVDLLAWGCVPVEVKFSTPKENNPNKFVWGFTPRQLINGFSGIFLFIAMGRDEVRSFVIPCDVPWLTKANRRPKTVAVSVTIGARHFNAKNWDRLQPYENAYHIIEEQRVRLSEALKAVGRETVKRAVAEMALTEPNLAIEELPLFQTLKRAA